MHSVLLFLENIKVFVGVQGLWKMFPSHRTQCLLQFESTEDDSSWQLLWACNQLENPEQKAELFAQILEEAHHAELFRNYLRCHNPNHNQNQNYITKIQIERKPLYLEKKDIWKYFPYCIVGESDASNRFAAIARQLQSNDPTLYSIFNKILSDEVGHIHKAKQLAMDLNLPDHLINKEIKQIKQRRFTEAWLRSGQKIITPIGNLLIDVTYFLVLAPFALLTFLFKKRNQGVHP